MKEEDIIALVVVGVFALIYFVIAGIFAYFIQRPLARIPQEYRQLAPGLAWLYLIPCVNIVIHWIIVFMIPDSLDRYFSVNPGQKPASYTESTKTLGIVSAALSTSGFIPYVGALTGLGGFVCLIIFLVQVNSAAAAIPDMRGPATSPGNYPPSTDY